MATTLAITNKFDGVLMEYSNGQEEYFPKNYYRPYVENTRIFIEHLLNGKKLKIIDAASDVTAITDDVRGLSITVPGTVPEIFDEIHTFFFRRSR